MANPEKRTGSGHYVSITRLIKLIALATNFCNVILFEGGRSLRESSTQQKDKDVHQCGQLV